MVLRLFLASVLILGHARSIAQIEKLTTTDEIVQFVHRVAPQYDSISPRIRFRLITQASSDSLVRIYHLQSFEKLDLDGNGITDLIFNGLQYHHSKWGDIAEPLSLAVLGFEKDSFYVRNLGLNGFEDIAARPVILDGKSYLQTIRVTQRHIGAEFHAEYHIDTLAWKFNAFIEKTPSVKRKIIQIDYNSWNGLFFQGNITLRIIDDSVRLKKEKLEGLPGLYGGGVFLTRLGPNTRQRLYGLLNAIDFVRLKDSYDIDAYDASTGTFRIIYDNGQTKMISDYGTCGTYGLAELHQLLYGLTETQHWVNADPVSPRCIDSLHSDAEVLGLVRTLDMDYPFLEFDPDLPVYALPDYRERLIAFGQQRWQKGDIDGNGHMDLLFNGYLNKDGESRQYSIVVLSFGGDSLSEQDISGANGFFAARIIPYDGHDDIEINYLEAIADSSQKKGYHLTARRDTLTASDGHIVERPAVHRVETINVHQQIGNDSILVRRDTIYWYKNDADPPPVYGDSIVPRNDSINLYALADPKTCQKLLSLAGGIRFERLNPELLMPNKTMRSFGSTWYIEYDGGKRIRIISDGLIGSYHLQALESYLWDLKHNLTDWKLVCHVQ